MQARKDKIRLRVQKHRGNGNKENKENVRLRVQKHRKAKDIEELREKNRKHINSYREHWGFNNKNELLGSGRLSPKANPDFKVELKLIQWEKRRLGIK